jgi:hypothetical protein
MVADRIDLLLIFALNALCELRRNDCQRNECPVGKNRPLLFRTLSLMEF